MMVRYTYYVCKYKLDSVMNFYFGKDMEENYLFYNTYLPTLWINVRMILEYSTFWKLALKLDAHWPFNEKLSKFNDLPSNTVVNKIPTIFSKYDISISLFRQADIVNKRNQK